MWRKLDWNFAGCASCCQLTGCVHTSKVPSFGSWGFFLVGCFYRNVVPRRKLHAVRSQDWSVCSSCPTNQAVHLSSHVPNAFEIDLLEMFVRIPLMAELYFNVRACFVAFGWVEAAALGFQPDAMPIQARWSDLLSFPHLLRYGVFQRLTGTCASDFHCHLYLPLLPVTLRCHGK